MAIYPTQATPDPNTSEMTEEEIDRSLKNYKNCEKGNNTRNLLIVLCIVAFFSTAGFIIFLVQIIRLKTKFHFWLSGRSNMDNWENICLVAGCTALVILTITSVVISIRLKHRSAP